MLANALQSKGSHEEPIRERQGVVEAAPGNVMFLAELGSSYAAAGTRSEALRILDHSAGTNTSWRAGWPSSTQA